MRFNVFCVKGQLKMTAITHLRTIEPSKENNKEFMMHYVVKVKEHIRRIIPLFFENTT